MAVEVVSVDQWIYEALEADGQLAAVVGSRLFADQAPQDASLPYVLWQMQSPQPDTVGVGGVRILTNMLWLVKVVDQTESYAGLLKAAADRIDEVLCGLAGQTVGGVTVDSCVRVQPFRMVEDESGGRQYRHLGGIYQIVAYTT